MVNNTNAALGSFRVLDLAEDRGLYAGKVLADFGADVIKVEPPEGSRGRRTTPFKDDVPGLENSLYFLNFNANKKGLTLNLETPEGQSIFKDLVKTADVVIEDFEVGRMKSLGLDYSTLREVSPKLVYASLTGFGQTGPYSQFTTPDIINFAMSGLMYTSGAADQPPVVAPCEQTYQGSSLFCAFSILAALFLRVSTGQGQMIDASTHEAMSTFNTSISQYSATGGFSVRAGSQFGGAPARIYHCKDGFVHILVIRPSHWTLLVDLMGKPDILKDEAWYIQSFRAENRDILDNLVTEFTMQHTKEELVTIFQAKGIPCTPVNTPADFANNPHEKERGYVAQAEHPVIGPYSYLSPPYRLSETPCRFERPAPLLGQHNTEILGREMGYSREKLAQLKAEGII
jgi:crotonobetainyl-CoA:carnitine CoA-transferase CaiB-like acyl-CoA transferase